MNYESFQEIDENETDFEQAITALSVEEKHDLLLELCKAIYDNDLANCKATLRVWGIS
jgi:hypothetical protein